MTPDTTNKNDNMIHKLKIKKEFAELFFKGLKPYELRKNDRNFQAGDIINFTIIESNFKYTRTILHVLKNFEFGIYPDYCIITLSTT